MNLIGAVIVISLSFIISRIINSYSLTGIFYFLSALNLVTILSAFSYKPLIRHDQNISKLKRIKNSFGLEILRKKKFVVWCVASFIGSFGWLIPIVNIVSYEIYLIKNLIRKF